MLVQVCGGVVDLVSTPENVDPLKLRLSACPLTASKISSPILFAVPSDTVAVLPNVVFFLVDEGVPLPEIQQALGHKSLASTGVYLKMTDERANRAVARGFANAF